MYKSFFLPVALLWTLPWMVLANVREPHYCPQGYYGWINPGYYRIINARSKFAISTSGAGIVTAEVADGDEAQRWLMAATISDLLLMIINNSTGQVLTAAELNTPGLIANTPPNDKRAYWDRNREYDDFYRAWVLVNRDSGLVLEDKSDMSKRERPPPGLPIVMSNFDEAGRTLGQAWMLEWLSD